MKLNKTARAAWGNIFRGLLLAATLELPWPHGLCWLWSIVNWGSAFMVLGSAAVLGMWVVLNVYWMIAWAYTDNPPYESQRPVTGDRMPLGVNEAGETVYARAGSLRYLAAVRAAIEAVTP